MPMPISSHFRLSRGSQAHTAPSLAQMLGGVSKRMAVRLSEGTWEFSATVQRARSEKKEHFFFFFLHGSARARVCTVVYLLCVSIINYHKRSSEGLIHSFHSSQFRCSLKLLRAVMQT